MSSAIMEDEGNIEVDRAEERTRLIRIARQRLESLARSGLDRLALPAPLGRPASLASVAQPGAQPARPMPAAPASRPAPAAPATPAPRPVAASPAEPPSIRMPAGAPAASAPAAPRGALPSTPPAATGSLFDEPALEPAVPAEDRAGLLATLAREVSGCVRCPHLAASRTQTVFGEGSATARLMFVGEAPGADEDASGRPFVGRSGALLTDMITKGMGLTREEVYIANILKSRPPENRNPLPEEIANCLPYLERQIQIVRPEFICLLGKIAASTLLETALPISRLRGKWHRYRGIPTIVTYHPSYLLRNPAGKKDAWADLQALMLAMGVKPPDRKKGG
ncbi:uracil-DNA glycosylase [Tundrisphaera sp. TA3]|uniref:uracil-DNA glycosylase n=1 Tax=Tundrisphaera sp. TA3 TaxID=3435775 RepID=UPI003EB75E94